MQESLQGKSWGQHVSRYISECPDPILNSTQNPQRETRENEPFRIRRNGQISNKMSPPPVKSQIKQQPHALGSYFPFSHLHLAPTELLCFSLGSGSQHPVFAAKGTGIAHSSGKQGWITAPVTNRCFQQLFYSAATFPRTSLDVVQEPMAQGDAFCHRRGWEWKREVVGSQQSQQSSEWLCLDDVFMPCKNPDTNQGRSTLGVVWMPGKSLPCHSLWCKSSAAEINVVNNAAGINSCFGGGIWILTVEKHFPDWDIFSQNFEV